MRPISALGAAVVTAAACMLAGSAHAGTAHADGQNGPYGCYGFGRVMLSPAVTMSPQEGTVRFAQNLGPCHLSDGSVRSGTLTGTGRGTFSCVSGSGTAQYLTRWENGRTSAGTFSFSTYGSNISGTGTVGQGEFAGDRFGVGGELNPGDPSACTGGGVKEADSYEEIGISGG